MKDRPVKLLNSKSFTPQIMLNDLQGLDDIENLCVIFKRKDGTVTIGMSADTPQFMETYFLARFQMYVYKDLEGSVQYSRGDKL